MRNGQNREGRHQLQQRVHNEEDRKRKREVEPEKEKQSKKKRIVWTDTDEEGSQEKRPTTLKRSDRARAPTPEISRPDEVEKLKKGLKRRRPLEDKEEEKELRTKLKEFLEKTSDKKARKKDKSSSSDSDFVKVDLTTFTEFVMKFFCLGILEEEKKWKELTWLLTVFLMMRQIYMYFMRRLQCRLLIFLIARHMVSNKKESFSRTIPFCFRNQEEELVFSHHRASSPSTSLIFYCICIIMMLTKCVLVDRLFSVYLDTAVRPLGHKNKR